MSTSKKKANRNWYWKNREAISEQVHTEYATLGEGYRKFMWYNARLRAKKKGLPFNITPDDIVIPETCPVFGFRLEAGKGKGPTDTSPSIDRINPSLGYVRGNIQIISHKANKIKSSYTSEDILKVATYLKVLES